MSLILYSHPLASFCQKVLIGLYERGVPFTQQVVDLGNPTERSELARLWPMTKFPVLSDPARGVVLPETSIILEYLDQHHGNAASLLPRDPAQALECRLRDRFYDLYVNVPMGKIVTDRLRPVDQHDPHGVSQARAELESAYTIAEGWAAESTWAVGDAFTLADCAAAPALFYANEVSPFTTTHPNLARYFDRLSRRPSVARVFGEAEPYLGMFPRSAHPAARPELADTP